MVKFYNAGDFANTEYPFIAIGLGSDRVLSSGQIEFKLCGKD